MASPASLARVDDPASELTSFVGRRTEITESKRALTTSRLVTVTGPGGVGKTRLAKRVGDDSRKRFVDGLRMVELADVSDPLLVTDAVVAALGVQGAGARWSLSSLIDYLADRRVLLLLDNCEHVLDAAAVLAGTLLRACPGLHLLATSRTALGVAGEVVYPLAPLSLFEGGNGKQASMSDAVELFLDRAGFGGSSSDGVDASTLSVVRRICESLDGMPLALELGAVRVRSLGIEGLAQQVADHRIELGTGDPSATPRHRTLENTIDWSYRLLTPPERVLWERLSVFAGGFELDAAQQVCGDGDLAGETIPAMVGALVEKSLVARDPRAGRERYRVLGVLRQFAHDRLTAGGDAPSIHDKHTEWIVSLGGRFWAHDERQAELFGRVRAERANIIAALQHCIQEPSLAERGIVICRDLWAFWQSERPVSEILRLLELLIDIVPADSRAKAMGLWVAAFLRAVQRDPATAEEFATQALAIGRRAGDAELVAWSLAALTDALWYGGRWDESTRAGDDAERLADIMAMPLPRLVALYASASSRFSAGDLGSAADLAARAVDISRGLGEVWVRAYVLNLVASIDVERGDFVAAEEPALESLRLRRSLGDRVGVRHSLEVLVSIEAGRRQWERAAALEGAAEGVWREMAGQAARHLTPEFERSVFEIREALGEGRFERTRQSGARLSFDEQVDLALGAAAAVTTSRRAPKDQAGPGRQAGRIAALSRREAEVARLVADGAPNADVAMRLYISERTVESHVASILRKLGLDSRVQLARWYALTEAGGVEHS